jgi:hypothetical protein
MHAAAEVGALGRPFDAFAVLITIRGNLIETFVDNGGFIGFNPSTEPKPKRRDVVQVPEDGKTGAPDQT